MGQEMHVAAQTTYQGVVDEAKGHSDVVGCSEFWARGGEGRL